jgi:Uma2 family endonuclease
MRTRLSVAGFEQMPEPEQPGKQELPDGELLQRAPARRPHNKVTKALYELLRTVLLDRLEMETGYQMSAETWLVPDISVTWPDQPETNDYFQGSPMIAIEVVSPGNTADEIDLKVNAY